MIANFPSHSMSRASRITGNVLAYLLGALMIFSGVIEFFPMTDPATVAMIERLGIAGMEIPLGIAKLVIAALFLIPRTSTVGFVFMVGYIGGILATNITHGFTFAETMPIWIALLILTICGWLRHPELTARLRGCTISA